MKKILGRVIVVLPAIAIQICWYLLMISTFNGLLQGHLGDIISTLFSVLAVIFVVNIVGKRDESSYRLLWVIVIVTMPVLGALLYFMVGNKKTGRQLKKRLDTSYALFDIPDDAQSDECLSDIMKDDLRIGQAVRHVSESTGFPVFKNDTSKYYPFGEDMFVDMCEDLKKAKKYIYVEYFIIQSGRFWDTLTDIMAEKASEGVDVRVMYDDLGSIGTYSVADIAGLSKRGIKCIPFNPFFLIRSQLNNRDHRKIMVIDGKVAYSGGVNLADEYINEVERFGRWKDIGFRITGKAVMSYAFMFAEFWNAFSNDLIDVNDFSYGANSNESSHGASNGYILPYYDSPIREEHTSNELFTDMLSSATDYVWFYTPYLILGDSLFDAFIRAAKRGVDVRIIMPGIPDKNMVFRLSRSYYEDLMKAGVKIYEYTPGFVHAKAFIADDKIAGIGTVNLDYRSLFLHFECNSIFYKADIIKELKKDILDTQAECVEITMEDVRSGILYSSKSKATNIVPSDNKKHYISRFINNILHVIAPLL